MNQRGFITGMALYAAIGAAVVIGGLSLALKVQSVRLDAAQQKAATAEANARQWQATSIECSLATEKLAKEGKDRAAAALAALRRVQAANAGSAAEIARLRASKAGTCEAAVKAVREGLKP